MFELSIKELRQNFVDEAFPVKQSVPQWLRAVCPGQRAFIRKQKQKTSQLLPLWISNNEKHIRTQLQALNIRDIKYLSTQFHWVNLCHWKHWCDWKVASIAVIQLLIISPIRLHQQMDFSTCNKLMFHFLFLSTFLWLMMMWYKSHSFILKRISYI